MATQSRTPVILLTRPIAQSARFSLLLRDRWPGVQIVTSPLIVPVFLDVELPDRGWAGLIFTSETAVQSAQRISAQGVLLPKRAFCVGENTAKFAVEAGFDAVSAAGNADALVALVLARAPSGPLLHLCGRDSSGDVAARLSIGGIETISRISYAQVDQQLSTQACALLRGQALVIAPVFSPRTATLLFRECARIDAKAPLSIVAISRAAGESFQASDVTIAAQPDAPSMVDAIATVLNLTSRP